MNQDRFRRICGIETDILTMEMTTIKRELGARLIRGGQLRVFWYSPSRSSVPQITSIAIKILKFPDTITEDHIANFNSALQFIQDQLQSRGSKFLSGAQPGFVDYMVWPWLEKLLVVSRWDSRAKVDEHKFKLLVRISTSTVCIVSCARNYSVLLTPKRSLFILSIRIVISKV